MKASRFSNWWHGVVPAVSIHLETGKAKMKTIGEVLADRDLAAANKKAMVEQSILADDAATKATAESAIADQAAALDLKVVGATFVIDATSGLPRIYESPDGISIHITNPVPASTVVPDPIAPAITPQ